MEGGSRGTHDLAQAVPLPERGFFPMRIGAQQLGQRWSGPKP